MELIISFKHAFVAAVNPEIGKYDAAFAVYQEIGGLAAYIVGFLGPVGSTPAAE